ncbi:hypothetical protein UA08_06244 [Talaromyces atroroseus]|uniref:Molybdenum cofactor sulfurase n=1 Tax=Talaromyces atroroseus TaxID=1441469 RepID=A0A225ADT8_TALAT|nr:hypothetical protein UA08_06244 [Talaromyces atroroseus]OKL58640.1 hypothetical protein UA08_06244 [Talaromyces atroroseus]
MASISHGHEYDVEEIRQSDYPMLKGETYLDHAGTTLYSSSLLKEYMENMTKSIYGNPHSGSTSSQLATARVQKTREHVLQFFRADPEHFDLVFVLNATNAMKLVAEAFTSHGKRLWYEYHLESHTSAVGIRELASAGRHCFESNNEVENWLEEGHLVTGNQIENTIMNGSATQSQELGLFSYPGQSNMTGARLPLNWVGRLRHSKNPAHDRVYTLLDAAALASTTPLDFSDPEEAADFTAISFYKIFGFPDLGGLIVRKGSAHCLLQRRYFGGGTVDMVVCNGDPWHSMKDSSVHGALEDGTLPFHSIVALDYALATYQRLYGSLEHVTRHTSRLISQMYHKLTALRHQNGKKVCEVYKDLQRIIAFNIKSDDGSWVKLSDLENAANEQHIHIRIGDVCNHGGFARHLGLEAWELIRSFRAGVRCGCKNVMIGDKPSGIARVSLGAMSNMEDVDTFVNFIRQTFTSRVSLYIQNILIYPIRGCSAWWVDDGASVDIASHGLYWDAQWCLVDLQTGTIMTPKRYPRMFLVYPEIDLSARILRIRVHRSVWTHSMTDQFLTVFLDHEDSNDIMFWDEERRISVQLLLYKEPDIQAFLTSALGIPCTLAKILKEQVADGILSETNTDNLDEITITNDCRPLDYSWLRGKAPKANGAQRPRQVSVAETLGANIVLSPLSENVGPDQSKGLHFAYIDDGKTLFQIQGGQVVSF